MLLTRVVTAVALLLILIPALFLAPTMIWVGMVVAAAAIAAWEWGRLCRLSGVWLWSYVATCACLVLGTQWLAPADTPARASVFMVATLFWLVAVPVMFLTRSRPSGYFAGIVGAIVLVPLFLAVLDLRERGPWLLLSVMALVWVADIAAYFAGRAFGKRKLAPTISPGKSWEGVYGALAGVTVYMAINGLLGNPLLGAVPWLGMVIATTVLTPVSVLGDLFESAMKREAGVKDSSGLLPGHGGVLDRVDALASTLPVAALLAAWASWRVPT